jgi:hypothetical protein
MQQTTTIAAEAPITELEEVQSSWSGFHKAYYGYRPRFASPDQWRDVQWIKAQIDAINAAIEEQMKTFAGRESLRENCWVVPETEPELIQRAKWLQEERDRRNEEWKNSIY